jgi:hypothetical protein
MSGLVIIGAILVSTRIHPPHWLHLAALFTHLLTLVVGFGSVLSVDWYGLLFLLRIVPMRTVLAQAHRMNPLIWVGLLGLVVSGALLQPEVNGSLTVLKMCCVLGVATTGVVTVATKRAMIARLPLLPRSLLLRGMILAAASQSFWWTAVVIGFLTEQARG